MQTNEKLRALREEMQRNELYAYLVPSTDPHQSEYVPTCWQRRPWLSGFTGSAGDVVITMEEAGLWTDGRYFLQAEQELQGSEIHLHRMGEPGVETIEQFVTARLAGGKALGCDPRLLSVQRAHSLQKAAQAGGGRLRLISRNLVDRIWNGRPRLPREPVRVLPTRLVGEGSRAKLRRLRGRMREVGAAAHVLSTLDSIAWLLNLRGADVDYNPVSIAYLIVEADRAMLFIDPAKLDTRAAKALARVAEVRPYHEFGAALRELARRRDLVWVDEQSASRWIIDTLRRAPLYTKSSPVLTMKSKKNPVEQEGMRRCHVRDGVAMVRFLKWLEENVSTGDLTELSAADRLEAFRSEGEHYQGLSFRTISGYAAHGAVIHYSVDEKSDVPLRPKGIYLIDSGAQYLDGTTDITRTILLGGRCTAQQRDRFTRVLQGHIDLARVRFPGGVRGLRLDTLARLPLWQAGLDYQHGTGHGVGAYLNVHEGPQAIGPRCNGVALEEGNVLSNEPGYYEPGAYGIRVENLVLVVQDEKLSREKRPWYRFETLTLCPVDTALVDRRLLSSEQRAWLNGYHREVRRKLSPHLDAPHRAWLGGRCAPI